MMRREDDFEYLANDLFQAVRLPYGGKYVGMYVLLPKTGVGLKDIAGKLTATQWKDWLAAFATKRGEVRMPRYKADFSASLKPSLAALGMPVAFDPDKADLLGMLPPGAVTTLGNLFISDVLHKTYLAVDESGTEAAAATAVIVGITSLPPPPAFTMVVDKPFFVAIADKPTGAILFFGSIGDPQ
jgi:serpin B